MLNKKEIKNKIKTVKNIKKITQVMELISIHKLHKIKKKLNNLYNYTNYFYDIIYTLIEKKNTYKHLFFNNIINQKINKNIGIIILSSNNGLCGSLNTNLFKLAKKQISNYEKKNYKIYLFLFGTKANQIFQDDKNIIIYSTYIVDNNNINLHDIKKHTNSILSLYKNNTINKIIILKNNYINTLKQESVCYMLLPIISLNQISNITLTKRIKDKWDYLYEPNIELIINEILQQYIHVKIYQSILENIICEESARMIAMKNANENSKNIIKKLEIYYNKNRQENINTELSEIISGM